MRTFIVVALIAYSACSDETKPNPYAQQCAAKCDPGQGNPCQGQDPKPCNDQCLAATAGLSGACGDCVIKYTAWGIVTAVPPATGGCGGFHVGSPAKDCSGKCGYDGGDNIVPTKREAGARE
jgi:hypothetical protein